MIVFSMGPLVMYSMIAWLPQMLTETAGVTPAMAGTMLSVYNTVGLALQLHAGRLLKTVHSVTFSRKCRHVELRTIVS